MRHACSMSDEMTWQKGRKLLLLLPPTQEVKEPVPDQKKEG